MKHKVHRHASRCGESLQIYRPYHFHNIQTSHSVTVRNEPARNCPAAFMPTVSAPGSSKKEAASPKCCRATLESHHNLRRSGNVCSRRAAAFTAMTDQFYYTLLRQPLSVPDSVRAKLANRARLASAQDSLSSCIHGHQCNIQKMR